MVESMYLELETVTPLFMYGADQNHPEIRAASIKGVIRWWWRAVAGNVYTIDDMRYKESEIFGGAVKREEKAEKIRSPTLLDIGDIDFKKTNVCAKHKKPYFNDQIDYLLFSAIRCRKDENYKEFINTGANFRLNVSFRRFKNGLSMEELKKQAFASLWLMTYLGGLGSRSRRGAGSLCVNNGNKISDISFESNFKDKQELIAFLSDGLSNICRYTKMQDNDHSIINPSTANVFLGSEHSKWEDAMTELGRWYVGVRRGRKFAGGFRTGGDIPDYNLSHDIKNKSVDEGPYDENRVYLGLPINYYFQEIRFGAALNVKNYDRRASPLLFGVSKLAEAKYVPRVVVFDTLFLPKFNGKIKIKSKSTTVSVRDDIIKLAINDLRKKGWEEVQW